MWYDLGHNNCTFLKSRLELIFTSSLYSGPFRLIRHVILPASCSSKIVTHLAVKSPVPFGSAYTWRLMAVPKGAPYLDSEIDRLAHFLSKSVITPTNLDGHSSRPLR